MTEKLRLREIVTPGHTLKDGRIRPGDRETYAKLLILSIGEGYCWPSNSALDGTKSGRTASRHLRKLEEAGYIKVSRAGRRRIGLYPVR
jgi:DNA-binding transcriptional ArsR family regulator